MKLNDITKHLITYLSDHDITTVNYFDRVTMYLDANTREEYLTNIMDANPNNKITMKEMTPNSHLDRYLELFQPKDIQFEELKAISGNCAITYVEFAIDFMTYDAQTLENLKYFFKRHVVHPTIKGKTRIFYHYNFKGSNGGGGLNETNYSSSEEDDQRMVEYIDDEARNDPDQKCQHVEYRIRGLNSVKNQGIITINNLLNFDHMPLWDHLLDIRKYNLTELGRLLDPSLPSSENAPTRKTFHKRGNKESDSIISLQSYLKNNPERESAFKEINTAEALKKLLDDIFDNK